MWKLVRGRTSQKESEECFIRLNLQLTWSPLRRCVEALEGMLLLLLLLFSVAPSAGKGAGVSEGRGVAGLMGVVSRSSITRSIGIFPFKHEM